MNSYFQMKCTDSDIPPWCQMKCPQTSDINSYFQMKCTDSDIPPNSDEVNMNIRYEFISSDDAFRFRYTHFYVKQEEKPEMSSSFQF